MKLLHFLISEFLHEYVKFRKPEKIRREVHLRIELKKYFEIKLVHEFPLQLYSDFTLSLLVTM